MATALVAEGLHQDLDKICAWPLAKLFTYAKIAAMMGGRKFD